MKDKLSQFVAYLIIAALAVSFVVWALTAEHDPWPSCPQPPGGRGGAIERECD